MKQSQKVSAIVGVLVVFLALAGGAYWYLSMSKASADLARWKELAAKHPKGEELMKELEMRLQQLEDGDAANDIAANAYAAALMATLGDKESAVKYYEKAIRLDPTSRIALNNLANLYQEMGNWNMAEKYYLELIRTNPSFTQGYRLLAYLYRDRFGDPEEKIKKLIDSGLRATNNDADLLNWMIAYYQGKEQGAKALPYSELLVEKLNQPKESPGIQVEVK